jgi:tetratricopeptide (TPR) repeat protein
MEATMKTTMRNSIVGVASLALALAGCAGAKPATKKEMSEQAENAPPPPSDVTPKKAKEERKVSKEANADFAVAVKFYDTAAADGLTNDECIATAQKFEQVASEHSGLPEAWFNAGLCYHQCNMTKEAEASYQKAIKSNPGHAPSLVNLGEIYYRGGNEKVAEQYFQKAREADGTNGAAYTNLAWMKYDRMRKATTDEERKKWEGEALFLLKNALAVDNDNVVARVLMAMVYMEGADKNKNRLDIAFMLLDGVQKNKPTLKDNATENEKIQFEKDMARYEENIRYAPLYNALGLYYMKRNNIGRALQYFRQAVQLDPQFVEARMNLGNTVLGFRKYDEAEEHYREVLKIQPKNYEAQIGLGVALRGQKKIDEAEAAYKSAMELDNQRGDAYYNLGVLWKDFRTNDPDQKKVREAYRTAKNYFQQFLSKRDVSADKKKEAQDNIEDCDKAISTLDQVIQQMESEPPPQPAQPAADPNAPK